MCLQCRVAVKIEKPLKGKLKVSQLKNEYKVLTQLNKNGKLVVESLPSSHPAPHRAQLWCAACPACCTTATAAPCPASSWRSSVPTLRISCRKISARAQKNISPSAAVLRGPVLAADQPHPRAADAGPAAAAARAGARVQGLVPQID